MIGNSGGDEDVVSDCDGDAVRDSKEDRCGKR